MFSQVILYDERTNGLKTPRLNVRWAQAYEKRMLRFNLEVVLVPLIALIVAIASLVYSL